MTTTNVQPTKGNAYILEHPERGRHIPTVMVDGENGYRSEICTLWASALLGGLPECERNAALIADAFNTHTTTGLTPSELAERLEEALKVCAFVRSATGGPGLPDIENLPKMCDRASAVLARAALTKSAGGGK